MRSKTFKKLALTAIALLAFAGSAFAVNWSGNEGFDKGTFPASQVTVDTTNFYHNLNSSDKDQQSVDNAFDAFTVPSETDPLSLHLNQSSPQTFTSLGGGTGLMKVTAGLLGLDTNTYVTSLTTSTPTNLTGFIKGNGSVLSADNSTYIASIADPNANRLFGWDDTDNAYKFITIGTNLSYNHTSHTLSATGGGGGMAIGSPVSGGTANEVLFIDASGNLADNAGFRFDNYDLFINNLSNSGTTVQIGASGLIIKDALYGDLLFSVSDSPEGQVTTWSNILDDGSGNAVFAGNVSIANTSDYSSGGINIISDNLRGNITLGGNGYYNDVGRLLFYSYDKDGILGYLTWRDDIDGFEIFSGDPGSPTLLMSMTSSGTILDNLKSGTLVSPPAGLAIGELWQDTTTSAQYPIVRIRKT